MKRLYVKILEAKDWVTDETLRKFEADFTCYYNGRLLMPSEEETKELWEFHPELWIRKPESIDYSKVTK